MELSQFVICDIKNENLELYEETKIWVELASVLSVTSNASERRQHLISGVTSAKGVRPHQQTETRAPPFCARAITILYYFIQFALRPHSNFGIRTGGGALRRKKFEQGGDEPGLNRPFADRMTGAPSSCEHYRDSI
jgi:hypothetical protein